MSCQLFSKCPTSLNSPDPSDLPNQLKKPPQPAKTGSSADAPRRWNSTLKSGKRLKPRSDKRAAQERAYNKRVAQIKAEKNARGECCPVMLALKGWRLPVTDCHHTFHREGKMLLDERYWLFVSREGHDWIGANPNEARSHGWLV